MLLFAIRTLSLAKGRRSDAGRLASLQDARLRSLVRRAVQGSPFYREKYRGIDPGRFRLEDLPPTGKGELMASFDRTLTDPAVTRAGLERFMDDPENSARLFLGRYVASHTSGSQGQPMLTVQDRRSVERFFGLQMTRGNTDRVSTAMAVRRLVRPKRLAVVTLKRGFYPSASLFQHMPAVARRFMNVLWLSQTDPDLLPRIEAFRPDALTAYAGVLEMLALEVEAGRLRPGPELRQVVNNSEVLTDRARDRIARAFGVRVMNNYATGECPFLTNGCPTDPGAHVNADSAILEVVDANYRPVPPGTPGEKVLITNLVNHLQPIIRYEVGDVVTMAEGPCGCGSLLPRVERIGGRAADVFWVGEGARRRRLINLVFTHALEYVTEAREWQAEQTGRNEVRVRLEPLPGSVVDLARARHAIDRELASYDYDDVNVTLEVVPRLEADPRTGKYRRMVGAMGPDDPPAPYGRAALFGGAGASSVVRRG